MEWQEEVWWQDNNQRQQHIKTDMSLCRHNMSAQHGEHVANIATFYGLFSCHAMSLIADMSEMQQPASVGETRQERWQCSERGVSSGDATKNNKILALGGGGGNEQR